MKSTIVLLLPLLIIITVSAQRQLCGRRGASCTGDPKIVRECCDGLQCLKPDKNTPGACQPKVLAKTTTTTTSTLPPVDYKKDGSAQNGTGIGPNGFGGFAGTGQGISGAGTAKKPVADPKVSRGGNSTAGTGIGGDDGGTGKGGNAAAGKGTGDNSGGTGVGGIAQGGLGQGGTGGGTGQGGKATGGIGQGGANGGTGVGGTAFGGKGQGGKGRGCGGKGGAGFGGNAQGGTGVGGAGGGTGQGGDAIAGDGEGGEEGDDCPDTTTDGSSSTTDGSTRSTTFTPPIDGSTPSTGGSTPLSTPDPCANADLDICISNPCYHCCPNLPWCCNETLTTSTSPAPPPPSPNCNPPPDPMMCEMDFQAGECNECCAEQPDHCKTSPTPTPECENADLDRCIKDACWICCPNRPRCCGHMMTTTPNINDSNITTSTSTTPIPCPPDYSPLMCEIDILAGSCNPACCNCVSTTPIPPSPPPPITTPPPTDSSKCPTGSQLELLCEMEDKLGECNRDCCGPKNCDTTKPPPDSCEIDSKKKFCQTFCSEFLVPASTPKDKYTRR